MLIRAAASERPPPRRRFLTRTGAAEQPAHGASAPVVERDRTLALATDAAVVDRRRRMCFSWELGALQALLSATPSMTALRQRSVPQQASNSVPAPRKRFRTRYIDRASSVFCGC